MQCNDIVMKAHQNRNMNYDEMHEYEMFNGAAQLARGIVLLLCKHNILFTGSYERNVSVQTIHISYWRRIASSHCWSEANWLSMPALMRRMVLYTHNVTSESASARVRCRGSFTPGMKLLLYNDSQRNQDTRLRAQTREPLVNALDRHWNCTPSKAHGFAHGAHPRKLPQEK